MAEDIHVTPEQDLREHDLVRDCWCHPRLEQQEDWYSVLVIHNAADGRELVEQHGVQ